LVFDMRFLRNPHWDETLRPARGSDAESRYIAAIRLTPPEQIEDLLLLRFPATRRRESVRHHRVRLYGGRPGRSRRERLLAVAREGFSSQCGLRRKRMSNTKSALRGTRARSRTTLPPVSVPQDPRRRTSRELLRQFVGAEVVVSISGWPSAQRREQFAFARDPVSGRTIERKRMRRRVSE